MVGSKLIIISPSSFNCKRPAAVGSFGFGSTKRRIFRKRVFLQIKVEENTGANYFLTTATMLSSGESSMTVLEGAKPTDAFGVVNAGGVTVADAAGFWIGGTEPLLSESLDSFSTCMGSICGVFGSGTGFTMSMGVANVALRLGQSSSSSGGSETDNLLVFFLDGVDSSRVCCLRMLLLAPGCWGLGLSDRFLCAFGVMRRVVTGLVKKRKSVGKKNQVVRERA